MHRWGLIIMVVCLTGVPTPARAQTDAEESVEQDETDARSGETREAKPLTAEGRRAILAATGSEDWILRAMAAMRLENRDDADIGLLLDSLLTDTDWRVRAFAARAIARREGGVERLAGIDDDEPRVLRVAMLYGVSPDPDVLAKHTRAALAKRTLASRVLGIELASMGDDPELRQTAATALERIILNMNAAQASYLSARLGPACGIKERGNIAKWQSWLQRTRAGQGSGISPRPTTPPPDAAPPPPPADEDPPDRPPPDPPPLAQGIDEITDDDFQRLIDYLGGLRTNKLELVVCFDASGSMGGSITATKQGIDRLVGFLSEIASTARVGIVTYQNASDPPLVLPLTDNVNQMREFLWSIQLGGGYQEPVARALERSINANRWSRDALRVIVLVGDEPFQPRYRVDLQSLLENAKRQGFVVSAVNPSQRLMPEWDEIARWGGGRSVAMEDPTELVSLIVSLTIGSVWDGQIEDFMAVYAEIDP